MSGMAERVFSHMSTQTLDYMLLFWLRHPEILNDNDLCVKLRKFAEQICMENMDNAEVRRLFFNCLRTKLTLGKSFSW